MSQRSRQARCLHARRLLSRPNNLLDGLVGNLPVSRLLIPLDSHRDSQVQCPRGNRRDNQQDSPLLSPVESRPDNHLNSPRDSRVANQLRILLDNLADNLAESLLDNPHSNRLDSHQYSRVDSHRFSHHANRLLSHLHNQLLFRLSSRLRNLQHILRSSQLSGHRCRLQYNLQLNPVTVPPSNRVFFRAHARLPLLAFNLQGCPLCNRRLNLVYSLLVHRRALLLVDLVLHHPDNQRFFHQKTLQGNHLHVRLANHQYCQQHSRRQCRLAYRHNILPTCRRRNHHNNPVQDHLLNPPFSPAHRHLSSHRRFQPNNQVINHQLFHRHNLVKFLL